VWALVRAIASVTRRSTYAVIDEIPNQPDEPANPPPVQAFPPPPVPRQTEAVDWSPPPWPSAGGARPGVQKLFGSGPSGDTQRPDACAPPVSRIFLTGSGPPAAHGRGARLWPSAVMLPSGSVKEHPQLSLSLSVPNLSTTWRASLRSQGEILRAAMAATHESGAL